MKYPSIRVILGLWITTSVIYSTIGQEIQECILIAVEGHGDSSFNANGLFLNRHDEYSVHPQSAIQECRHFFTVEKGYRLTFVLPNRKVLRFEDYAQVHYTRKSGVLNVRVTGNSVNIHGRAPVDYTFNPRDTKAITVKVTGCDYSKIIDRDMVYALRDGGIECFKTNQTIVNEVVKRAGAQTDPDATCTDGEWTDYDEACKGLWTCIDDSPGTATDCQLWGIAGNIPDTDRQCTANSTLEWASFKLSCIDAEPGHQHLKFAGASIGNEVIINCNKQAPDGWKYNNGTRVRPLDSRSQFECGPLN